MQADIVRLRGVLGDRYAVEHELGRGGMATVYLARDLVQDRTVAIKVLHPDLSAALGAERFRREIEIERLLEHPNILGVLESGEADGLLYFSMPFVSGESLRARMDREGQLPVDDALRIAADVAEALDYAHRRGVLHRDVKPENILLEDGHVFVADFGIARALSDEAGQRLTQTGVTLGTPVYMSPEQSFAERDLDGRSDLYSLGCVLYEMLVGTPPFTGPNAQAITARHHLEEVPSITVVRPTVSDAVEDLVLQALAKSRADRCDTGEFASRLRAFLAVGTTTERRTMATRRDLSRVGGRRAADVQRRRSRVAMGVAAAALLVAAAIGGLWYRQHSAPLVDARTARVAVLYFRDASAGGRLGYLADGLTEALIDGMASAGVDVVSRGGVLPFRGTSASRDSVNGALQVAGDTVGLFVDGVVAEADGRAAITVTLADPGDARVKTRRFELPLDSVGTAAAADRFAPIEDWLRQGIGQAVSMSRTRVAAENDAAWTLLQRAEYDRKRAEALWQGGDTTRAAGVFATADSLAGVAAERAPRWAGPPTLRGRIAHRRSLMTQRPGEAAPLLAAAAGYAAEAVRLGPDDADALELRGTVAYARVLAGLVRDSAAVRAQVDSAARDLKAAVAANPKQAGAWVWLSRVAYQQLNRIEARDAAQKAYEADAYLTNAPAVLWRLFATSYDIGEGADAERWCFTGQRRFPDDPLFLQCELLLMTMRGARPDVGRGWQLVEELNARWPRPERAFRDRFDRMLLAAALGRAGLADSARQVMVQARADRTIDPRGELQGLEAFARTVIGDHAVALDLLEGYLREFPEHREGFRRLNTWWWQDIQSEPRYVTLVRGG